MGAGNQGIRVHPVPANVAGALRFEVHGMIEPSAVQALAIDEMWADLRQENPRLYDGPVLLADRHAVKHGRLLCFRGSYKHLAVSAAAAAMKPANAPPPPFLALGVQGVVVGKDADGDEVVLMGLRSSETRIYGGLWENAPSGTVPPPPVGQDHLDWPDVITALRAEGVEELGINLDASSVSWIALLEDRIAGSMDVVLRVELRETVDAKRLPCPIHEGRWEYADAAWVPVKRLASWIAGGASVSPPTAALFKDVGWT